MVSTQRPAATLDDWEGPLYPSPVKQLATVLRRWRTDMTGNQWLGCACRDLGGYVLRFRIATQDGYKWWWFLQFELGGGHILVALPWPGERSPAVYRSSSAVSDRRVTQLLEELIHQMEQRLPGTR